MSRPTKGSFFVLLPTLECNLNCAYCFESHPVGQWNIDETRLVLEKIFSHLGQQGISHCRLHWQGGEPFLLGTSYWEAVLPMACKLADHAAVTLRQSLHSNMVLYHSGYAHLLHEYCEGTLGSSFELSTLRKLPDSSHERFRHLWLQSFAMAQDDGISVGVLALLDDASISRGFTAYAEELRETCGIRKVRFTLPFRPPGCKDTGFWMDPVVAGQFLAAAFRTWYEHGGDTWMEIRPFLHLMERFQGTSAGSGLCLFTRNCSDIALAIAPSGTVLLCDNFVNPDTDVSMGNIFQQSLLEIHSGKPREQLRKQIAALVDEECRACRYLSYCFGGCLARSRPAASQRGMKDHYCQTYRMLFETIEKVILAI